MNTLADKARAVVALDRAEDAEAAVDRLRESHMLILPAPVFEAVEHADGALRCAALRVSREWFATLARARWARVMGGVS